ncbi:MAG: ribosomal protein [Planctomycetaceae bacterium]|nr:ribosomal protein [Planctomycetaceae bacterium]
MSRIGKKPIAVPADVDVKIAGGEVAVKGKNGELKLAFHPNMQVGFDGASRQITVQRPNDERQNRALHGLTRSLINNMVVGVSTFFIKKLEIQGVGYQAAIKGKNLELQVGFANIVKLPIPAGVIVECPDQTHVNMKSADKHAVGQFAAIVRGVKPPEPYKGKGIRYAGEYVRRKAGKAFGSS